MVSTLEDCLTGWFAPYINIIQKSRILGYFALDCPLRAWRERGLSRLVLSRDDGQFEPFSVGTSEIITTRDLQITNILFLGLLALARLSGAHY
jgi:hypothetical protein